MIKILKCIVFVVARTNKIKSDLLLKMFHTYIKQANSNFIKKEKKKKPFLSLAF